MKKLSPIIIVILGIAAAAMLSRGFPHFKPWQALSLIRPAQKSPSDELVEKIARHMVLPDEPPLIATVTDATKLKEQVFFRNARNGDKVLIYEGLKKAILYDPQADRIVEVGHINLSPGLTATGTAAMVK